MNAVSIPKVHLKAENSKTVAFLVDKYGSITKWCSKMNISPSNLYAALLQTKPELRIYKPQIKTRANIIECLIKSGGKSYLLTDGWDLSNIK